MTQGGFSECDHEPVSDSSIPAPTNELSVVGLVCGVLALIVSILPVFGFYLSWIFAVPALIFGGIGLRTGLRFGARTPVAISALLFTLGSFVMTGFWFLVPVFLDIVADQPA